MTKESSPKPAPGIPAGNTVLVVGDPGTGKSTFLLTFFSKASVHLGRIRLAKEGKQNPLLEFDKLLLPVADDDISDSSSPEQQGQGQSGKTLRCFVSLENGYDRVRRTQPGFFSREFDPETHDVFIDASSLLSGRLEDMLRYPSMGPGKSIKIPSDSKIVNISMEGGSAHGSYQLTLDNWGSLNDPERPDLEHPLSPYETKEGRKNNKKKERIEAIRLVTSHIDDPGLRIRLLKDVLAVLFHQCQEYTKRVLVLDSLSALLSGGVAERPGPNDQPGRRLNLVNLVRWLEEAEVTTLMSTEANRAERSPRADEPIFLGQEERYVASGVIQLEYHRYRSGDIVRFFRIMKMRGCNHDMRRHCYFLGDKGIERIVPLFGHAEDNP